MKKFLVLISIVVLVLPNRIMATSGFLRKSTIKECEGVLYGQHGSDNHFHVAIKNESGSYSATGDAIYTDPCPVNTAATTNEELPTNKEENLKSSDNSLKEILVDGDSVEIKDTMEYKTSKEKINLEIKATDENAKVEYEKPSNLNMGNNIINIKVTAEDATEAKYVLIIVREKALSNNTEIEVKIDGEVITFEDYKYAIDVKNDVKSLDIDYTLKDDNSKVSIEGNDSFVTGKNDVKITVTAEDGTSKEYIITVTKLDFINSLIKVILGSSVVVAIVAFVKKFFK